MQQGRDEIMTEKEPPQAADQDHKELIHNEMMLKSDKAFYLNLGCGSRTKSGLINCDSVNYYAHLLGNAEKGDYYHYWWNRPQVLLDIERPLPFKSNSIAGITLERVFSHIKNHEQLILEIKRILIPGGWAFSTKCSCDNVDKDFNYSWRLRKDEDGQCSVFFVER
jgi:SAM-dependent methyltransferase